MTFNLKEHSHRFSSSLKCFVIINTGRLARIARCIQSGLDTLLNLPFKSIFIDWLFTVLRPAQEYFTYMETSPLPVKGCKILASAGCSGPLSREGSLSCYTCCDTGLQFFRSHPKDRPIQSPLTTHEGVWRIYSNPDPRLFLESVNINRARALLTLGDIHSAISCV
jgi:hypothetical protein